MFSPLTHHTRAAALGVAFILSALLALPAAAAKPSFPRSFNPETVVGFTNSFSSNEVLAPACPGAIAATPGSDPATKELNNALNTSSSFAPGGTVHYTYNPAGSAKNITIQDCVVTYPSGFFSLDDFDPTTGVLTNAAYSKSTLSKGGTQIDGASLSGIPSSSGPSPSTTAGLRPRTCPSAPGCATSRETATATWLPPATR